MLLVSGESSSSKRNSEDGKSQTFATESASDLVCHRSARDVDNVIGNDDGESIMCSKSSFKNACNKGRVYLPTLNLPRSAVTSSSTLMFIRDLFLFSSKLTKFTTFMDLCEQNIFPVLPR